MLFQGLKGCFSPLISTSLLSSWVKNGGSIMQSEREFHDTSCFFCAEIDDPWVKKLSEKSVTVLHASWVSCCVVKQFTVPISRFVLDDSFDPNQIILPVPQSTSHLHRSVSSSKETEAPSSSSASATGSEPHESFRPLKRQFHEMHSPTNQDDVGYSPARIRPAKRQRMRSSCANDLSRSFVRPSVKIVTSKLFAASPSQTSSISIQDQTRKRNSFQESAHSNSSTLNSPSRTCLPFATIPFESFPRFDLRHALSLNQPPLRQKNRTPLRIRLKTGNESDSSAFTLFWNRASTRSAVQRVSSKEEEPQIASTLYIAVSSLPGFAHCTTGSCPLPDFPTTFLPGKIHLGKKFCTEKRATTT